MRRSAIFLFVAFATTALVAQQPVSPKPGEGGNRIDTVTPTAPELAPYGPHDIGVRTIQVTDKNRPDILNTKEGGPVVRYDRTLRLEVWYPATLATGQKPGGEYRVITRDPAVMVTLCSEAPTSSDRLISRRSATRTSTLSRTAFLNPWDTASILYEPGGRNIA